jgi:multiple sugar transport system substrate-binding protein
VRKIAVLACAIALAVIVPFGRNASAEPVTLDVFYAFPSFAKFHDAVAKEFMKRHPDIRIEFRAPAPTYDDGHQAMMREAVTNQLPDVYFWGYHLLDELVHTLVKRNQVLDLGPLLDVEGADFRAKNYAERILSLGKVDGKLYGLAFNASTPIMFYNVDLVQKAGGDPSHMPEDWEATMALGAKIHALAPDVVGLAYNVHHWPGNWLYLAMIQQAGGTIVDGQRVPLGGPELGAKVLERFRRFVTEDGMPLIGDEESRQQFVAGKVGIYFDSPGRLKQLTDLVGQKFNMRTAVFPVDSKTKGELPTGGNAGIITTHDPKKQKAAWEYLKFVTGPEAQTIVVQTTGYLPTNRRAVGPEFLGPFFGKHPNYRTVAEQLDRSGPWVGYPAGNTVRIWRAQRDIINAVMHGSIEPKAGYAKLVNDTAHMMK